MICDSALMFSASLGTVIVLSKNKLDVLFERGLTGRLALRCENKYMCVGELGCVPSGGRGECSMGVGAPGVERGVREKGVADSEPVEQSEAKLAELFELPFDSRCGRRLGMASWLPWPPGLWIPLLSPPGPDPASACA